MWKRVGFSGLRWPLSSPTKNSFPSIFAGTSRFSSAINLASDSARGYRIENATIWLRFGMREQAHDNLVVCRSNHQSTLPMVSMVSLSSIRSWARGMSMCIRSVCCCLLKVSDVRVFLLGTKESESVSMLGSALCHIQPMCDSLAWCLLMWVSCRKWLNPEAFSLSCLKAIYLY